MKSLLEITHCMLADAGLQCGANPNRDCITVARRVKDEGNSFLTITLPAFCSDFDRSLADGRLSPALTARFKRARGTRLPRFLGGFVEMVFDSMGVLLPHPSADAIRCIRQICLLHKKLLISCSRDREKLAEKAYVEIEREMRLHVTQSRLLHIYRRVASIVMHDLVRKDPFGDPYVGIVPRHGPGTTAEGVRGNKKFLFTTWPQRLESSLPLSEFGVLSLRNPEALRRIQDATYPTPRLEQPVKVVFVPKTLRTPRVIACEPIAMQWAQQAVACWLRDRIEQRSRYLSGRVNFTRQDINASIALAASEGRVASATIDLSDASDRVSAKLVMDAFKNTPALRRLIFATRSTRAKLPNGNILLLRKFASMGSALCFPVEAVVFFLIIVSGRIARAGVRPTPSQVKRACEGVYVYGDDIIVPNDEAPLVINDLVAFGLKVNSAKSFWTGKFRESCGVDAYDGVNVTPVYARRLLPNHRADVHGIVSAVSLGNQLYQAGFWKTAQLVRKRVEKILGPLPTVLDTCPGLGWLSYSNTQSHNGWSERYQRLSLRCWVPTPIMREDILDDDPALLKCLTRLECRPPSGRLDFLGPLIAQEHLSASVRYGNLALKRRWI